MALAGWLDEVRRVLAVVRTSDATQVEVTADGFALRLTRRPGRVTATSESRAAAVTAAAAASDALSGGGTPLVAPLTGVFYRASTPGAPPFASVGDVVAAGAVVGLIETMKIFNEVLAERGGRITAILAESGQLVHAGETLMTIEDAAEASGEQASA